MKLNENANVPLFLEAVQKCRGEVWFTTPEGDHLNLKSTLSQFVFAAVAAGKLEELNGDVVLEAEADRPLLARFLQ